MTGLLLTGELSLQTIVRMSFYTFSALGMLSFAKKKNK